MSITLLGQAQAVADVPLGATPGSPLSQPSTLALDDGTVLVAWLNHDTGTAHLHHYSRDLSTLHGQATVAGSVSVGLYPTPDGPRLATGTTTHPVATGPLTIGAGSTVTNMPDWWQHITHALPDGRTLILASYDAYLADGANITHLAPLDDLALGVHLDDGTPVVSTVGPGWDYVNTWALDPDTGAQTLTGTGPTLSPAWLLAVAPTRDGLIYPAMIDTGNGEALRLHDATGTVLADPGWPPAQTYQGYDGTSASTATHTAVAWWNVNYLTGDTYPANTPAVAVIDRAGALTTVDLDVPLTESFQGLQFTSPNLTAHGTTAVLAVLHFDETVTPRRFGIRLWTVSLPPSTVEGILAVDTIDQGRWWVGTRDPDMAYELVIDTATQRLVEIVAGQEHLATWELCVSDGFDWHVAALMRPDV